MVSTHVCFTRGVNCSVKAVRRSVQATMLAYVKSGMVGRSMRCAVSEISHQRGHNEKDQSYQEARDKQK